MTHRAPAVFLAVAAAFLLGGCGGEAPATESSTSDLSRGLLSAVGEGGGQVPADERNAAVDSIEVDVNALGHDRGDPMAPVKLIELSDYGCGYCRRFHQETWPVIEEEFIATGKVHWKFLPYVTGMFDNSLAATEGAECALAQDPALFRALDERLWAEQSRWKGASDPEATVRAMAGEVGVELEAWDACMASNERIDRIRAATALARDLGVRGTPTFFMQNYPPIQGALPTETFTRILGMVHTRTVGGSDGDGAGAPGGGSEDGGGGPGS